MKRIYLGIIVVLLLIMIPIALWFVSPNKQLNVAIIDKTVKDESYREHLGLTWLLNFLKYEHRDGQYDESKDYFGTIPDEKNNSVSTSEIPKDYKDYDAIYLADTYGVYEDDLNSKQERLGARTKKIVGGLESQEWDAIMKRLTSAEKSLFIAEFNSIASPTSPEVRNQVLDYLKIDWSGWIGRYFEELDYKKNNEIPQWVVDKFKDDWKYEGGGFILVNDFTDEVFVLELNKHIDKEGIYLNFTKAGQEFLHVSSNPRYDYWFDIVTAKNEQDVLANYEWSLTDEGKKLLSDHDVPFSFAAVVSGEQKNATKYYFAGDFNDINKVPFFYKIKGLASVYKVLQNFADDAFYWSAYVPMMKSILEEFEKKEVKQQSDGSAKNNLGYNARINDQTFQILKDGQWESITLKGVNMGMGKPGYFPGEAAITEDEYYRWFQQIGKMNANTIRVYTLHPPGFYRALKRYNDEAENPLYVLHGVWIEEEGLEETLDAYDPTTLKKFQEEMKTLVDVIHGNKYVEHVVGHASGYYDTDVSQYIIGWIIGIEWYPHMVNGTNEKHATIGQYDGVYFETKNASPFEYWIAEQMDYITQYEQKNYGWMHPMSFTNWVTTDLLDHPSEPNTDEDIASVNPNVIYTKGLAKQTGQFASYHVYPYYPDFFNYDQKYLSYVDHRGEKNSYAGYLAELHAAHRMPILIAEFGIPGSRGLTHDNPYGWTQGFVSEQEQGEILTHLFEDIMAEDLLGGLVFTWQDEWFKRTWNTMDYDNPNQRPYWSNAQTNEQQFGLLSFDQHKVQVDGDISEWKAPLLYEQQKNKPSMSVDYDERYLYLQLKGDLLNKTSSTQILLDVIPNQGKTAKSDLKGVTFSNGIEFVVELNKKKESRIVIDPYYDFYSYLYGHELKLIDILSPNAMKENTTFSPIYYALNKELYLPEQDIAVPFAAYETGKLIEGNGNPKAKNYNSLVDYNWSDKGIIELRIPWLLLQAKDPSHKEFIGDFYKENGEVSVFVDKINIGALFVNEKQEVVSSLPEIEKGVLNQLHSFTWDNWKMPKTKERLKKSYEIMQETFKKFE